MSTASAARRAPAPSGIAISLCDATEMGFLRDIEKLTRKQLTVAGNTPAPQAANGPRRKASEQYAQHNNKTKRRRRFTGPRKAA